MLMIEIIWYCISCIPATGGWDVVEADMSTRDDWACWKGKMIVVIVVRDLNN
jgi:hypothetical protein